jgi:GT2 family glycosyltransferase
MIVPDRYENNNEALGVVSIALEETQLVRRRTLDDMSVIIPTLGRATLEGCLKHIAAGSSWPQWIIVVDQGSNEGVDVWVRILQSAGLRVRHIKSTEKGVAAAMNRGMQEVQTEAVAVTHDDCHVAVDWLDRMAIRVRQEPSAITTGRVEPAGDGVVLSVITSLTPVTYRRPLLTRDVLFPNNMGFTRYAANKVGPFDENPFLAAAEDNDWQYRALRAGIPIIYAPEVVVSHLDWRDKAQLEATYRAYIRSQGGLYGKYLRRGDFFMALRAGLDLARGMRRYLHGIIRGDYDMYVAGRIRVTQLLQGIDAGFRAGKSR